MEKSVVVQLILDCGAIAIFRQGRSAGLIDAAEAIVEGGISAVEFTLTTPDAKKLVSATRERLGGRAIVGAGTVLNAEQARAVLDAGAQFIVMPVIDRGAIETALAAGVPVLPGAFTPTEVLTAHQLGADLVKLFPASIGGAAYVRALLAPLPQVRLVPTGGISAANAGEYIHAGAAAVAVGSNLTDSAAIARGDFQMLKERAEELARAVQQARAEMKR